MKHSFLSLIAVLGALSTSSAQTIFTVAVTGGKEDLHNANDDVPSEPKPDPSDLGTGPSVLATGEDGKPLLGQLAPPRLLGDAKGWEFSILVPELKAGKTIQLKVQIAGKPDDRAFSWGEADGLEQLSFDGKPVLRYFHQPFDAKLTEKGKETANPTTKPYHHLFAADGTTIVTNSNQGQYPHHRGIYFGFNNITYGDGKKADVWHCRNGESTAHEKVLSTEAGPLFGRHTLQIAWNGQDGKPFANEKRELTVFNLPGGKLIEFDSLLTTPLDKVRLDGDPQHAGFHFRANAAMEKNTKETFFIRPDGKGKPGEEKNWLPKGKGGPVNLPWNAMSFVLDGKRYTVVYLDHPDNPKEARQSERCYGRVGTYFEYDLTKDHPLNVKYRLWFQEGEPTMEQCAALSQVFVASPTGKIAAP